MQKRRYRDIFFLRSVTMSRRRENTRSHPISATVQEKNEMKISASRPAGESG
jgi:hypothetical protein